MEGKNHRKKVTFAWNNDDVNRINASMFAPHGENFKFIDLPLSNYASSSFDTVTSKGQDGRRLDVLGLFLQRAQDAVARLGRGRIAKPGTELTLIWGEESGGTKKTTVERHKQTEVKVVVGPTPYAAEVREGYEGKWRHQARNHRSIAAGMKSPRARHGGFFALRMNVIRFRGSARFPKSGLCSTSRH